MSGHSLGSLKGMSALSLVSYFAFFNVSSLPCPALPAFFLAVEVEKGEMAGNLLPSTRPGAVLVSRRVSLSTVFRRC